MKHSSKHIKNILERLHEIEEKIHGKTKKLYDEDEKIHEKIKKEDKKQDKHKHNKKKQDKIKHPNKVKIVMEEFKKGKLHSGSKNGPIVTNPKQAIAIGISEQKKLKHK